MVDQNALPALSVRSMSAHEEAVCSPNSGVKTGTGAAWKAESRSRRKLGKKRYRLLCYSHVACCVVARLAIGGEGAKMVFCATTLLFVVAFFTWVPRIPASSASHDYADTRMLCVGCGCPPLPNYMDVLTNLPIGLVAWYDMYMLM